MYKKHSGIAGVCSTFVCEELVGWDEWRDVYSRYVGNVEIAISLFSCCCRKETTNAVPILHFEAPLEYSIYGSLQTDRGMRFIRTFAGAHALLKHL